MLLAIDTVFRLRPPLTEIQVPVRFWLSSFFTKLWAIGTVFRLSSYRDSGSCAFLAQLSLFIKLWAMDTVVRLRPPLAEIQSRVRLGSAH